MPRSNRMHVAEFCTREDWLRVFGMDVTDYHMDFSGAGLRFKLGLWDGCDQRVEQFVSAFDRARTILDRVFASTRPLSVLVSYSGKGSLLADLEVFREIREGVRRIGRPHECYHAFAPDQSDEDRAEFGPDFCTQILFTIKREHLVRVIWGALAIEIGIRPRIRGSTYIADKALGIVAHPYDDRGMDLGGPNRELLRQIYVEFNDWLLDSKRAYMDEEFGRG